MEVKPSLYRGVDLDQFPLQTDFEISKISKMYKAFLQAVIDHGKQDSLSVTDLSLKKNMYVCLSPQVSQYTSQGKKLRMEDASYLGRKHHGASLLSVTCDGHNDDGAISQLAVNRFQYHFEEELEYCQGDVKLAFKGMIQSIHQEATKNGTVLEKKGSTLLVSHLELSETNLLYTGTLGDSWSMLYRREGDKILCIPLSKKKNLADERVVQRLIELCREENTKESSELAEKMKEWPKETDPKKLRLPGGLNCSHALADGWYGNRVSQQANYTIFQVKPNDLLINASDGAWDVIQDQEEFMEKILRPNWDQDDLAEIIVQYVEEYVTKQSLRGDNVSVITVRMRVSEKEELSDHESSYEDTEMVDSEASTQEDNTWEEFAQGKTIEQLVNESDEEDVYK